MGYILYMYIDYAKTKNWTFPFSSFKSFNCFFCIHIQGINFII